MILGIGTDMVDARRIERLIEQQGERFLTRIYTDAERAYADSATDKTRRILRYANRFAAKEATIKALGHTQNISWQDMEVIKDTNGKPLLTLYNNALIIAESLLPAQHQLDTQLSLSDEYPYSIAFVTLSARLTD